MENSTVFNISIQDIPKFSCNVKAIFSQKQKKIPFFYNYRQWSQKTGVLQAKNAHFSHMTLENVFTGCSLVRKSLMQQLHILLHFLHNWQAKEKEHELFLAFFIQGLLFFPTMI